MTAAEHTVPRLAVVSLWAEDVIAAAHFYRDVIGLNLAAHHAGRPHFDLGGTYLAILRGRPLPAEDPDPPRFPVIAITVDDFVAALDRLAAAEIPLPWGVEEDADSRWVMFQDPGGNLIEIVDVRLGVKRES
jgi:catechol-2,3-dioxygenase